ncbi:MAG TPA: class I SAM-dependent methyltransferase [Aggregatilineales bacterium]|nr:class I SAM-dependent methyltransferase [Anaerolineales bacterium]HRE49305.1 class I SAM-dependent methyltransferase [Aggregatilineales bacterium]
MDRSLLVRLMGFPATLLHGDTLVLDRWLWLRRRLPYVGAGERLIDLGCGSGAFTIGAAKRGYHALGVSWDERNQQVAAERAALCHAPTATFTLGDLRELDQRTEWHAAFEVALCSEVIEHLGDDRRLMTAVAACLKPGGRLLLTTPNYAFRYITRGDLHPYPVVEDGGHMRRGYTPEMLRELCDHAGLRLESVGYCSGILSQQITRGFRHLSRRHELIGWGATFPLRALPPLADRALTWLSGYPYHTICLIAYKPRF